MVYTAESDPLCYPNTSVLINSAGITDQETLDQFELSMFITRSEERLPEDDLSAEHYCALHHHLFQDVYSWAGQFRTIRIGKGGNWFCYPEHIERELGRVFNELEGEGYLRALPLSQFAERAAHYLAELNAIHPFREGNGRTQLVFLNVLAEQAGFIVRMEMLQPNKVIPAMIESFSGDEGPLARLICNLLKPGREVLY